MRRFGLRICGRGGKNARKRAVIAVARKLAVLLPTAITFTMGLNGLTVLYAPQLMPFIL